MATQCKTCAGVYSATSADGAPYFHACPGSFNVITGKVDELAQRRDENLASVTNGGAMKAAGKGTTTV